MCKIKNINRILPLIISISIIIALSTPNLYSQCCSMKGHGGHSGGHSEHSMQTDNAGDTTLIRKGIIDVYEIDLNMDGFVYQDQMDWNVISDKPGKCPICGMELIKTKNEQVIKNLKEHNFKVKQ